MARTSMRERPDREEVLWPVQKLCPACSHPMRLRYDNCRTLVTLTGSVRLRLKIRTCETADCVRHHRPYPVFADSPLFEGSTHCLSMSWTKKSSLQKPIPFRYAP